MYNIIVFGTGSTSQVVVNSLNCRCKIVAFIDNDPKSWGVKDGIFVKSPASIKDINYNYIIIASQYNESIYNQLINLGISKEKILQFYRVVDTENNYVNKTINLLELSNNEYEMIATGISYCNLGLRDDIIKKKCLKIAFSSQDLYYDYNTVKYILNKFSDKCENLRYCLIGMSYYSFQYDMSLSSMKNKVLLYYETMGLYHNNPGIIETFEDYCISKKIADKLFEVENDGKYSFENQGRIPFGHQQNKYEIGKIQAERDCNKNYPETVRENKEILRFYLQLLKDNNIKPIIVIFPVTKYYRKYFSNQIKNEFYDILDEIRIDFDFQYIDCFDLDIFEDNYFYDVSHLNYEGAEIFTKILNKIIQW